MRPTLSCRFRIRAYNSSVAAAAPVQRAIRAAYYRGGTSRAVIIHPQDLPSDLKVWPDIFRQVMGSGDPYGRQLDGMGAGISSLSKICLVESCAKERGSETRTKTAIDQAKNPSLEATAQKGEDTREAHVDYTFVGLGIENDEVDVAGNCGNMSSAIGPYAYNARLLPRRVYEKADGNVTVTIRNTNTRKLIDSTFTVVRRQAAVTGNFTIDGVTGKGSQIKLDFRRPYGSKTGKVLPTGKKVDIIVGHKVTCVDGANPAVFIRADDIGVDGTILPNDFNKLPEKLELLEKIRTSAAVAMGIAKTEDQVPRTIPKIGIVSMSSMHPVLSGHTLKTSQMDLVVRFISDTQPHRAIPLTAALTTAVAARIPGTIVEQLLAPDPVVEGAITIGHASGRLQVNATMDPNNPLIPLSATVYRTAKRLFEGNIYWTPEVDPIEGRTGILRKKRSLGMAFVEQHRKPSHIYPAETTIKKEQEVTRTEEYVTPSSVESQDTPGIDGQPQHVSLQPTEGPVPRSILEPPDYPSEEVPSRNFGPGPRPRLEASEVTAEDLTRHLDHYTITEQASWPKPSAAYDETTWEPRVSGFLDAQENPESHDGNVTQAQARSKEPTGATVHTKADAIHQDEAYDAVTARPLSQPHPLDPILAQQDLKQEINSVKRQIDAHQNNLRALKLAHRIQVNQPPVPFSFPSSSSSESDTALHCFTPSSQEKGTEWHRFAKGFTKRKEGLRKRVAKDEESEMVRAVSKRTRKRDWGLDRQGNLRQGGEEKVGRGW